MAKYSRKGAGNFLSVYELLPPVSPSTNFTLAASKEIDFDQTFASAFSREDSGAYTISLDQDKNSKDLWTFFKDFVLPGGSSSEDEFYEDGSIAEKVVASSAGGSTKYIGIVWHGELHPKTPTTDERRCFIAVAQVSTTSGAFTTNNADRTKPTIEIKTIAAQNDVVFNAGKFNPALVVGTVPDQTLPKGSYGEMVFLDVP